MSQVTPYSTREYPPWAETMFRILRSISYLLAVGMGIGLLFFYPNAQRYPNVINELCGWISLLFGSICFLASLRKRWIQEWVALFFLCSAIGIYVIIIVSKLTVSMNGLAGACAISWLLMLNLFRLAELSVFFVKSVRGAKLRRGVGRRVS